MMIRPYSRKTPFWNTDVQGKTYQNHTCCMIPETSRMFLSDFSFHSIGLILTRLNKSGVLLNFVQDAFLEGAVSLVHLAPEDTQAIVSTTQEFGLDFDDAYQYVTAEKHNLVLVSYDADFDRTDRGRKTPHEVMQT